MSLRHVLLACPILLLSLAACDRTQPTAPTVEAAYTGAAGPTVKAPSNTNAVAGSESQIDVSWRDNSTNETGFEVHRSASGPGGTFALRASTGANVASYRDTGLTPSTQYCYKVRAFKRADGRRSYSGFSNTACATTPTPPAPSAPSGADAKPANSTTVDARWIDNSTNEGGFRVQRSLDLGSTWTIANTTAPNVTAFSDGGRASEQQICYRVIAFNGAGDSPPSNTDCTTPPAGPTSLTATGADQEVDLAWTDKSAVEDGYELRRSTDGVTYGAVASVPSNSTTYRDGSVSENTTYWYIVRAKKDGGFSDPSGVASAAAGVLTPPAAPGGLRAYTDGFVYHGIVELVWSDGSGNEDGFKIERCQGYAMDCADADFTLIATTGAHASSDEVRYVDFSTGFGGIYTYRVRAFNRAGDSAPSNVAQVMVCDEFGCPSI
jgi:fibronectin type III domain protein